MDSEYLHSTLDNNELLSPEARRCGDGISLRSVREERCGMWLQEAYFSLH